MVDISGASADAGVSAAGGPAPSGGPDPADLHDEVGLLFRRRAGQLSATLARILGLSRIDLVEDVVHDAFVRALRTWPHTGMPDNPTAWILRVARNRALDLLRREGRWQTREAELERSILPGTEADDGPRAYFAPEVEDDQLRLMFACCDPLLSLDAQVALTLKVVGAFSVPEIARAFYATPPTIAQRIVRAKRAIRERGATLEIPSGPELSRRRDSVLEVLYLMFNEGYVAYEGEDLVRDELCAEAIRLVELVAAHPVLGAPSVHALAALFFFHAARGPGRVDRAGALVPLERQDRDAWDRRMLRRGLEHLQRAGRGELLTPYHLQAEIAGCHALAPSFPETDWAQILECYDALLPLDPSPVVALNRVVAVAEVHGAEVALQTLSDVAADGRLDRGEGRWAIEGDLLERVGRLDDAAEAFRRGAAVTRSGPVRRHLEARAASVVGAPESGRSTGRTTPATASPGNAALGTRDHRATILGTRDHRATTLGSLLGAFVLIGCAGGAPPGAAADASPERAPSAAPPEASAPERDASGPERASSEDAPPIFRALAGSWRGEGELFGRPAVFSMEWASVLGGTFYRLQFRNGMLAEDETIPVLEATAYYQVRPPHAGSWIDTRGELLTLALRLTDSTLVVDWTSPSERGRTTYSIRGQDRLDAVDEVQREGRLAVFGRASYVRSPSDPGG